MKISITKHTQGTRYASVCVSLLFFSLFEDPFLKAIQSNVNLVTYGGAIEIRTDSIQTFTCVYAK